MALPGNGITVSLVRNTLGENKNDVGQLCTSNKINPNSFYKPITRNKLILTDADFYAVNDGFNVQSYNSPITLWNAIVNGETWTPLTAEAPYRLGDFRWYDHNAGPWFEWSFMDTSQARKGESRPIQNNGNKDLAWVYNNFAAFSAIQNSGGNDNACLGLLMSPNWTGNDISVYFYRICSILDYDSERLNFTVPSDLNSYDRNFKFTPVISTYMMGSDGSCTYFTESNPPQVSSWWYPLRCNLFQLYLKNENWTPTPAFTMDVNMDWVSFDYTFPEITNLTGQFTFTISAVRTYPVTVSAEIKYMNSSSPVTVAGIGGTIAAGNTTLTQNWSYKNTITVVANLKDDSELPFTVEWTYSYLGNTFRGQTSVIAPRVY